MRRLLEFHRSPNSVKVRIALEVKRLEYETEEMFSADREPIVAAGGWPLVPILIDGAVRMRESAAILHYLEANYRDLLTPTEKESMPDGFSPPFHAKLGLLARARLNRDARDLSVAKIIRAKPLDEPPPAGSIGSPPANPAEPPPVIPPLLPGELPLGN